MHMFATLCLTNWPSVGMHKGMKLVLSMYMYNVNR